MPPKVVPIKRKAPFPNPIWCQTHNCDGRRWTVYEDGTMACDDCGVIMDCPQKPELQASEEA